jgi:hypothetical protein
MAALDFTLLRLVVVAGAARPLLISGGATPLLLSAGIG